MLAAMTPHLWILAAFTAVCAAGVVAFGIAEHQRFTDPRPAARHRRRMSRLELAMEAREAIYTFGYAMLGLYLLAAAGFAFALAGMHRLDAWRMRRFWGDTAVHS